MVSFGKPQGDDPILKLLLLMLNGGPPQAEQTEKMKVDDPIVGEEADFWLLTQTVPNSETLVSAHMLKGCAEGQQVGTVRVEYYVTTSAGKERVKNFGDAKLLGGVGTAQALTFLMKLCEAFTSATFKFRGLNRS